MMNLRFSRLLLIQDSEKKTVSYIFIFSLLLGIPQIATMTAASALLLRDFPPEFLPELFLYNGFGISVFSIFLMILIRNRNLKSSLIVITGFLLTGTAVLLGAILLFPEKTTLSALLFFWTRLENSLLAVGFLLIANSLLPPRASRRLLGLTASGQVLSLIAGGLLIPLFLDIATPVHLLWFSLLAYIILFFHVFKFPEVKKTDFMIPSRKRDFSFVFWIFLTIGVMYLLYYTVDTAFLGVIDSNITDPEQIAKFLAGFWVVVGIIALLFKTIITGRFLHRFGLVPGLVLPSFILIILLGCYFLIFGSDKGAVFILIIVIKAAERILDGSLFIPAFYGFFQGLVPGKRQKTQLLAESLVGQGAAGIAGILFLFFRQGDFFDLRVILAMSAFFGLLLIVAALITHGKYHKLMEEYLNPLRTNIWKGEKDENPVDNNIGKNNLPLWPTMMRVKNNNGELDPVSWQKAFQTQVQVAIALKRELPLFPDFEPLLDAWSFEWDKMEEILIRIVQGVHKSVDLLDRWKRFKNMSKHEQLIALEGFSRMIPQPWKDPVTSILAGEEAFLIQKSVRGFGMYEPFTSFFTENNKRLSLWTREIIKMVQAGDYENEWNSYSHLSIMRQSEFFGHFPYEYLHELLPEISKRTFLPGEKILTEGDKGESMHIQSLGTSHVHLKKSIIATLGVGECFGELSSILPERRSATILADTVVHTLEISGETFLKFLDSQPSALKKIQLVLYGRLKKFVKVDGSTIFHKITGAETNSGEIFDILMAHPVFSKLSTDIVHNLSVNSSEHILQKGDELFPGEIENTDGLYLLVSGKVSESWGKTELSEKNPGAFPGVHLLVDKSLFRVRIRAIKVSRLVQISRSAYLGFLSENPYFQMVLTKELVCINRELLKQHC